MAALLNWIQDSIVHTQSICDYLNPRGREQSMEVLKSSVKNTLVTWQRHTITGNDVHVTQTCTDTDNQSINQSIINVVVPYLQQWDR